MKRFYKSVDVAEVEAGWSVSLDGKLIKTPAKRPFATPTKALAEAAAAEWDSQDGEIKPAAMPITKSVNTALDRTMPEYDAVADMVAEYGGSDLICYRAEAPAGLITRQTAAWDPLLEWSATHLKARLITTVGVIHMLQPKEGQDALTAAVRRHDPFELTGLYDLVALSGSLIIGLAVAADHMTPEEGWATSRVDHIWQEDQWGVDDEAAAQAAYKAREFVQAARLIELARTA